MQRFVDYLNANLALTWKITPDLTFKTTGGYVLNKRRREEFNGSETYTGYAGSPSGKGVNGAIYWTDQTSWSNENTLNYKKRLGRSHNLDLMAGLSLQGQKNTYDGVASTQISSEELAQFLADRANSGAGDVAFVIGSSHGLSDEVKRAAALKFSMGRITMPHQLARLVLTEQIYRACTINAGMKYHK